ncbi:MAG: HAD family hydrolase [Clostridium sp.]
MVKNIIFDLGRVLLSFEPQEYLKTKIGEDKMGEVARAIFRSEEWLMLDRGTITEIEAMNVLTSRHPHLKKEIEEAFDNWYEILVPMEETVKVLKNLKNDGFKIFYLSNFHDLAFKYVNEKHDFFKLFDGGVVSYEENLLKPEREIYEKLLRKYDLKGEECVFIDDTEENVIGAREVSINGIIFKDAVTLTKELEELIK